ncbi:cation:dicarboxylate symporter family transporter [Parasphaerochaeta coccoides]|nr:cation:dicarboxylase symporter family transporter [Parasphaerochaeta coccoides]
MKTWISYTAAMLMGLAATLLFGDSAFFAQAAASVVVVLIGAGFILLVPFVFVAFSAGTASLRKNRKGWSLAWTTILWSLALTVLLPLVGSVIFHLFPVVFPVTSTAGVPVKGLSASLGQIFMPYLSGYNPLVLLAAMALALTLGYFLRPDADVIRPAYAVTNSFSEVFFRFARGLSAAGFVLVFFFSVHWFVSLYRDGTVFIAGRFLLLVCGGTAIVLCGIVPLVYGVATGFRRNPYRALYRLIAPALMALFSGSIYFSWPVLMSASRHNNGVQKRIVGTAAPLYIFLGRGGTAFMATLTATALLYAATGSLPAFGIIVAVAGASMLVSFASAFHPGFELMAAVLLVFRFHGINLYGGEATLLAFLPLLNGMGLLLDVVIAGLGQDVTSAHMKTAVTVDYRDIT